MKEWTCQKTKPRWKMENERKRRDQLLLEPKKGGKISKPVSTDRAALNGLETFSCWSFVSPFAVRQETHHPKLKPPPLLGCHLAKKNREFFGEYGEFYNFSQQALHLW